MIQPRLTEALQYFVMTSEFGPPAKLVCFVKEDLDFFFNARFSLGYLATVTWKRLTRNLLDVLFPVPLYHLRYVSGPGQDILARVKRIGVPAGYQNVFLLAAQLHSASEGVAFEAWVVLPLGRKLPPLPTAENYRTRVRALLGRSFLLGCFTAYPEKRSMR